VGVPSRILVSSSCRVGSTSSQPSGGAFDLDLFSFGIFFFSFLFFQNQIKSEEMLNILADPPGLLTENATQEAERRPRTLPQEPQVMLRLDNVRIHALGSFADYLSIDSTTSGTLIISTQYFSSLIYYSDIL
jgi:hypothetical protein